MIPIPYGTKHTVEFRINVWKPIICERCGCEFAYRIVLRESASSTNVLWLNRQGTINSATSEAKNALMRAIEETRYINKSYSCPNCGIYQSDMADKLIANHTGSLRSTGIVLGLFLFGLLALIISSNLSINSSRFLTTVAYLLSIILSVSMTVWFFIRSNQPFNPNAEFKNRAGEPFSDEYPVLERIDLEALVSNNRFKEGPPNIILPLQEPSVTNKVRKSVSTKTKDMNVPNSPSIKSWLNLKGLFASLILIIIIYYINGAYLTNSIHDVYALGDCETVIKSVISVEKYYSPYHRHL